VVVVAAGVVVMMRIVGLLDRMRMLLGHTVVLTVLGPCKAAGTGRLWEAAIRLHLREGRNRDMAIQLCVVLEEEVVDFAASDHQLSVRPSILGY
jgi:hypothetical protein